MLCEFAMQVWTKVLKWMQRLMPHHANWEDHVQWMIKNSKGKSDQAQIFKMVYAEMVYAIWSERNQQVFELKTINPDQIGRRIAYICNVRASPVVRPLIQSWLM